MKLPCKNEQPEVGSRGECLRCGAEQGEACIPPHIVVTHVYPPIPFRNFDWCAYVEGTEETGRYGYGRTKQEAIDELMERIEESRP